MLLKQQLLRNLVLFYTTLEPLAHNAKRTQRDYTLAFKLSVVEQVERGELTYK